MDMYISHRTITEVSLYNCSILNEEENRMIHSIQRPAKGISAFVFGFSMTIVYILCLQAMIQPKMISKACYKIMFCHGMFEFINGLICNSFIAYAYTFGLSFCDAPNFFYFLGCLQMMCWTGASFFCLLLAVNRMVEVLKFKRETINFLFSPNRTMIGCLLGLFYSLYIFLFQTPMVYSNVEGTVLADPLNIVTNVTFQFRDDIVILNNLGVVVLTFFLYSIFGVILYKKFKGLPQLPGRSNRLQYQVFLQATLMCGFNFFFGLTYSLYIFFPLYTVLSQIVFTAYQYSLGFS